MRPRRNGRVQHSNSSLDAWSLRPARRPRRVIRGTESVECVDRHAAVVCALGRNSLVDAIYRLSPQVNSPHVPGVAVKTASSAHQEQTCAALVTISKTLSGRHQCKARAEECRDPVVWPGTDEDDDSSHSKPLGQDSTNRWAQNFTATTYAVMRPTPQTDCR